MGARPAGTALALGLLLAGMAGCGGGEGGTSARLLDGSRVSLPAALRGLGGSPVATRLERVAAGAPTGCSVAPLGSVRAAVRRVGVRSETVTLRVGRDVRACDRDRSATAEIGGRWCGVSAGRLRAGRLRDPRLDLCADSTGRLAAAFAWIQPSPATRFVVVDQPGYEEVYRVAGGLPVRISTATDIDGHSSSAVFVYAEYSASGRMLGRTTLRALVAG
jgi:hypothetical protein